MDDEWFRRKVRELGELLSKQSPERQAAFEAAPERSCPVCGGRVEDRTMLCTGISPRRAESEDGSIIGDVAVPTCRACGAVVPPEMP